MIQVFVSICWCCPWQHTAVRKSSFTIAGMVFCFSILFLFKYLVFSISTLDIFGIVSIVSLALPLCTLYILGLFPHNLRQSFSFRWNPGEPWKRLHGPCKAIQRHWQTYGCTWIKPTWHFLIKKQLLYHSMLNTWSIYSNYVSYPNRFKHVVSSAVYLVSFYVWSVSFYYNQYVYRYVMSP